MGTIRVMVPILREYWVGVPAPYRISATKRLVVSEVRNEPVLATLRKLTGKDFGYDKAAWQQWWDESKSSNERVAKSESKPARADNGAASRSGKKTPVEPPAKEPPAENEK